MGRGMNQHGRVLSLGIGRDTPVPDRAYRRDERYQKVDADQSANLPSDHHRKYRQQRMNFQLVPHYAGRNVIVLNQSPDAQQASN